MPLAALREILAAANFRPAATPEIRGADPVLRTRYLVGTAGAAALAAVGLAADALWQLRGGRPQRVAV
ncbi:MAG: CoA transferase, partial [Burkholderiales bacterium]